MIQSETDLRRKEEHDAYRQMMQDGHVESMRTQLQAAVELLGERLGLGCEEVNRILAERVGRLTKKSA